MQREKLVQLVTGAQQGDQKALNELFNSFYENIHYHILKRVKDNDLAQRLTQDAFIEVFKSLHTLREPAAFVSWMMKIVGRYCVPYCAEDQSEDLLAIEDENGHTIFDTTEEDRSEFIPDEAVDKKELKQTILSIVDSLPDAQRAAVLMYYFDELSVKEIADIQNVSEGTVKSRLNYARKAIKASVEAYEQKHGVQLHAMSDMALLRWLRRDGLEQLSPQDIQKLMLGISGATEIPLTPTETPADPVTEPFASPQTSHALSGSSQKNSPLSTTFFIIVVLIAVIAGYLLTNALLDRDPQPQQETVSMVSASTIPTR